MARTGGRRHGGSARWLTAVLVAVLAVGAIGLSVLAVVRTQNGAAPMGVEGEATASATPHSSSAAPSPSPSPSASPPPGAAERFLSVGAGAMWRATGGLCGQTEPLLERSADGGATWQDVTPRYRNIGQILSLDAFAGTEAQIVALVGADCQPQALRTFTQGTFWEPYPDVLAASTYVDPARPGTVVVSGATVDAPCSTPWGVRAASGTVGVICDGTAYRLTDGQWQPIADQALAVAADAGGITAAAVSADCDGVWLVGPGAPSGQCSTAVIPAPPVALAGTLLWTGADLVDVLS